MHIYWSLCYAYAFEIWNYAVKLPESGSLYAYTHLANEADPDLDSVSNAPYSFFSSCFSLIFNSSLFFNN